MTNLSVNPARSTGPAVVVGGWAFAQLWMFWLAPLGGALLGGLVYRSLAVEAARVPLPSPRVAPGGAVA